MKIKKEINLSFKKRKGTEFPVIMISIDSCFIIIEPTILNIKQ